jgi:hypothetical protein
VSHSAPRHENPPGRPPTFNWDCRAPARYGPGRSLVVGTASGSLPLSASGRGLGRWPRWPHAAERGRRPRVKLAVSGRAIEVRVRVAAGCRGAGGGPGVAPKVVRRAWVRGGCRWRWAGSAYRAAAAASRALRQALAASASLLINATKRSSPPPSMLLSAAARPQHCVAG